MMHNEFNLVLKYCEVLDEFIKIRVFSDEDARNLIKSASTSDKATFQREVIRSCIVEYNDSVLPRLAELEEAGGVIDVDEVLYLLCVDVNPALDIHQVSVRSARPRWRPRATTPWLRPCVLATGRTSSVSPAWRPRSTSGSSARLTPSR